MLVIEYSSLPFIPLLGSVAVTWNTSTGDHRITTTKPSHHNNITTASQQHNYHISQHIYRYHITTIVFVVCFDSFIFLSLLNFSFSCYQLYLLNIYVVCAFCSLLPIFFSIFPITAFSLILSLWLPAEPQPLAPVPPWRKVSSYSSQTWASDSPRPQCWWWWARCYSGSAHGYCSTIRRPWPWHSGGSGPGSWGGAALPSGWFFLWIGQSQKHPSLSCHLLKSVYHCHLEKCSASFLLKSVHQVIEISSAYHH